MFKHVLGALRDRYTFILYISAYQVQNKPTRHGALPLTVPGDSLTSGAKYNQFHLLLSNYRAATEYCTSGCFPWSWSHTNVGCFDPTPLSSHDPISSHSDVLCIQILTFHLHKHFHYLRKHLNYAKIAVIFTVEDC